VGAFGPPQSRLDFREFEVTLNIDVYTEEFTLHDVELESTPNCLTDMPLKRSRAV